MSDTKPATKLIDYKNVRVSLVASVICFVVSNVLYIAMYAASFAAVGEEFNSKAFETKLESYAWIDRLSTTFNALFFISLVYLLIQIVQYYKNQPKK